MDPVAGLLAVAERAVAVALAARARPSLGKLAELAAAAILLACVRDSARPHAIYFPSDLDRTVADLRALTAAVRAAPPG